MRGGGGARPRPRPRKKKPRRSSCTFKGRQDPRAGQLTRTFSTTSLMVHSGVSRKSSSRGFSGLSSVDIFCLEGGARGERVYRVHVSQGPSCRLLVSAPNSGQSFAKYN